jgi:AcrR family transcriptional regulator
MPRVGLNRHTLVSAAIDAIDDGQPATLAQLTLAGLASRVGVAVPSLYKHVASLADLRREVAIASVIELTSLITAATSGRDGDGARGAEFRPRASGPLRRDSSGRGSKRSR